MMSTSSLRLWIMLVFVGAMLAVAASYPLELGNQPQQFELDFLPIASENSAADLYRMIKRDSRAVKRERIIMDALGGDYLVKRSIQY
uniref:Cystatin domain-containing protein n=1 Tax=Panagrellus redivivus TaxID=6233 RepID=A0A7E4VKE6_PANRE